MAGPSFTLKSLRVRCDALLAHVQARSLATPEELKEYGPGGPENPGHDTWAWVRWYGHLCRFNERQGGPTEMDEEGADFAAVDALMAKPLDVRLTAGPVVRVHPKSFRALLNCHARSELLGWMAERLWALRTKGATRQDVELVEPASTEMAYQYGLLAWAVTHEGPDLPFEPTDIHPELPDWIKALEPWDFIKLAQAHAVVNAKRLVGLEALVSRKTKSDKKGERVRPSWSVFFSRLGKSFRISPRLLMKDHSLAELVAASHLGNPAPVETNGDGPDGSGSAEDLAEGLEDAGD